MNSISSRLPLIDVAPLVADTTGRHAVAAQIGQACRDWGFFYITGHGVSAKLQQHLDTFSRQFFALDEQQKMAISMARGGRAWRGYFPTGGELTSGQPDLKEGIYFGAELGTDHPLVQAGTPLHGPNLFPAEIPQLRDTVLAYIAAMTNLGHALMRGLALSLGRDEDYFAARYTRDPLILFRIFHYPPSSLSQIDQWGVGEHTDYGLLTMLKQDDAGGLEVKTAHGWVGVPPVPDSFVCNIGDMLERLTSGRYKSTPHRVRNVSGRSRLSFPFFFDPNFHAEIEASALPDQEQLTADRQERWDHTSVHEFSGTWGEYLRNKISQVFPQLRRQVL